MPRNVVYGIGRQGNPREVGQKVRGIDVSAIFSENVVAKILQVAQRSDPRETPLKNYPHTVPQTGDQQGRYEEREADFWTCGFFPGSIYCLLERTHRWPNHIYGHVPDDLDQELDGKLGRFGRHYGEALRKMSNRTDTHDMGFIIQPAMQKQYELTGSQAAIDAVSNAAHALASRWDSTVKAIRSWDQAINHRYSITDPTTDFLVIIDSMCNLDLLYYVGHREKDDDMISIATTHAHTVRNTILRDDYSSYHLVNFDPKTGDVKAKMTNQGWKDESCWTRGQAWAIMGFAQTYQWTRDPVFLDTAIRCADYFLSRLRESKHSHPLVPVWDFDAPQDDPSNPLRDSSAGVIAANGLLLIHSALTSLGTHTLGGAPAPVSEDYLLYALQIVQETISLCLDPSLASFNAPNASKFDDKWAINESSFDAILRNATTNANEHAHRPYEDHGLVYADYYFLEFGNKLLRMGLL